MSTEIKLIKGDVEEALAKLQTSANALKSSLPADIGQNNVLTTVDRLNQLNQVIIQVTETYKTLLLQNEQSTRQSVAFLSEADEQISSYIKMR
ncbi:MULTISPECIES: YwqI/YxiC family protein [Cytobacillus]|uniref:YwqI/YxiC family protein n=1 Tax=Cytobacillus stercorigallinarum TaxID=2762240 RepID=A0ABR8QVX4_9BACI|nr:YwqI/YxiC family protein [Cytobacillus stercorigallinarum]MBD7939694.1 YwqI/YxiC family protein [Cytobacillus stercorigallinarum]